MIETGTFLQQRYRIDKQIGQGGMGAVYVATDERFGSTVAIKETLCMDDNFRKAIEREARLLNSLKHTALPRVSDHFEESNGQFLVMEYIQGEDVGSMLETDHASFTVEQVMKWADQLLDALDYLHNQVIPVIHRDIKPQNLKINSRGEIILLDFGLAKGNPTDASHQTAAKSIFGYSRNYASLEQIQGTGTDPRSDLYSLAATLYHLLTKVPPEDALTRAMSVLSQKPDPLQSANALDPVVPRGISGVLRLALDLNASERPSSASDMRQMLRESEQYAHLADESTIAAGGTDARVFAQATRLMPEGTRADAVKQTDIKTEVLPRFVSDATAVRGAGTAVAAGFTTAAPKRRRGFAVAAGALSMLLVGAVVAGGIYMVKPSVFGIKSEADDTKTVPVTVIDANPAPATTADGVQPGSESSVGANTTATSQQPGTRTEPVDRPADVAKTGKSQTATKNQAGTGDEDEDEDEDKSGTVVVTGQDEKGNTTTMRVDRQGNPPPNMQQRPPPGGYNPFPGVDLKTLTPAQRQKVLRAMRNAQKPIFNPAPPPMPRRTP